MSVSYSTTDSSSRRPFDARAFRRRLWIVLVCAVLGAAGAYVHAKRTPDKYSATAELLFGANSSLSQLLGLANGLSGQDATAVAATNVELASLPVLTTMTEKALGKSAPPGGVSVSVAAVGAGNLVSVKASAATPALAALVANVYARQFVSYTRSQQVTAVAQAIGALQTEIRHGGIPGTPVSTLRASLSQLQGIAAVEPVDVQIAEPAAAPLSPSSPHPLSEGVLGLLIGAVVGLMLALLADRLDPRLHSFRTLAAGNRDAQFLPWVEGVRPLARQTLLGTPGRSAARTFRRIMQTVGENEDSVGALMILVTSGPGKGEARTRTAVAWGLARSAAMAADEHAVILVQLAEDRIDFAERIGLSDRHGWVDVLEGRTDLSDAVEAVEYGAGRDRNPRQVDVLLRPGFRRAYATLDDEGRFRSLVAALALRYRCVILEAPPVDGLDAAAFLVRDVDAVVAVARLHRSRRDDTEQLIANVSAQRPRGLYVVGAMVGAAAGTMGRGANVPELVGVEADGPRVPPYDPFFEHVD